MKRRVAVLISGSGSNLQALIDASGSTDYPAEISLAISNRPDAFGLTRAAAAGITTLVVDHKIHQPRRAFEEQIDQALRQAEIEIVCLAGFMRILTSDFVQRWEGRILNIHPSLLPAFKGLNVQQQALDAGAKVSGCTVHIVTADLDDGPILGQATVPVEQDDTARTLAARILKKEHKLYPDCLRAFAAQLEP